MAVDNAVRGVPWNRSGRAHEMDRPQATDKVCPSIPDPIFVWSLYLCISGVRKMPSGERWAGRWFFDASMREALATCEEVSSRTRCTLREKSSKRVDSSTRIARATLRKVPIHPRREPTLTGCLVVTWSVGSRGTPRRRATSVDAWLGGNPANLARWGCC